MEKRTASPVSRNLVKAMADYVAVSMLSQSLIKVTMTVVRDLLTLTMPVSAEQRLH